MKISMIKIMVSHVRAIRGTRWRVCFPFNFIHKNRALWITPQASPAYRSSIS